jgi:hypothetical protein
MAVSLERNQPTVAAVIAAIKPSSATDETRLPTFPLEVAP